MHVHNLMQGQTSNKAKQHSTPKAVKNELPEVGLEPATLDTRHSNMYICGVLNNMYTIWSIE